MLLGEIDETKEAHSALREVGLEAILEAQSQQQAEKEEQEQEREREVQITRAILLHVLDKGA